MAGKLEETEKTFTDKQIKTEAKLAQLEKECIPIGFTYVQLPKNKAPSELWPSMNWSDVSSEYAGVFFRVIGSEAASFGELQEANAPRLETVHISDYNTDVMGKQNNAPFNMSIPVTGWSEAIFTGRDEGSSIGNYYMNFKHSDIAEVRPKNMAIKVFQRIA